MNSGGYNSTEEVVHLGAGISTRPRHIDGLRLAAGMALRDATREEGPRQFVDPFRHETITAPLGALEEPPLRPRGRNRIVAAGRAVRG